MWCALTAGGARTALLAGTLAALSPLVLEYGQQARAYVFAAAAGVLAVGALMRGRPGPAGNRWLAVGRGRGRRRCGCTTPLRSWWCRC